MYYEWIFILVQCMKQSWEAEDSFLSCALGFNDAAAGSSFLWDWFYQPVGWQGILLKAHLIMPSEILC